MPDWVKISSWFVGVTGGPLYCIWFSWYMTTKRMPELEKQHTTEMQEMQRAHAEHVSELTVNHRQDIQTMWMQKREDDKALLTAIQGLTEATRLNNCKYAHER